MSEKNKKNVNEEVEEVEKKDGQEAAGVGASAGSDGSTPAATGTEPAGKAAATDFSKLLEGVNLEDLLAYPSVAKAVQSRTDKRVTQAIQTARTNWESQAAATATMTPEQKAQYEFEQEKAAFEQEKANFQRESRVLKAARQLVDAGLPDLSEYITGEDDETTAANIAAVAQILSTWKAQQLSTAMRGTTPKDVKPQPQTLTREQIEKMSHEEIREALKKGLIDYSKL